MQILMGTDGTKVAENALRFGAVLARAAQAQITLLGVARSPEAENKLRASLAQAEGWLGQPAHEKIRRGHAAEQIIAEANEGHFDLVVVGSRGRRGIARLLFGSVASRLARYAPVPALIVKGHRVTVKRVLACTSGDARGERPIRWGAQIARWLNAELSIVHVMSQMALAGEARLNELSTSAEEAIAADTREGRHFKRLLQIAQEQGVTKPIQLRLRHGLVLDEVVAEATTGNYDLVVIGAHEVPLGNGLPGFAAYLFDDVADQIISALNLPVLVVRK